MPTRFSAASSTAAGAIPFRTSSDSDSTPNAVPAHSIGYEDATTGNYVPVKQGAGLPIAGASSTLHDASAAISQSSNPALAAGTRLFLEFINTGTCALYINFGAAAAVGQGSYPLQPGGSLRFDSPGFVPTDAVFAIAAATGGSLTLKWG